MKWKKIPKDKSIQPKTGKYRAWKQQIADEGFNQCVYCAIHEANFGGIRNFHVEHYKPKSIFEDLENDIKNLFYSCAICNTFKGADWPDEPLDDYSNVSYPYPGTVDYSDIFKNNLNSGHVEGTYTASKYMAVKLFLNRPQLIMERRVFYALSIFEDLKEFFKNSLTKLKKSKDKKAVCMLVEYVEIISEMSTLQTQLRNIVPYKQVDVKREK